MPIPDLTAGPATDAVDLDWDVDRSRARGCKRWSQYGPEVLDLGVAEMDLPVAPPILAAVRDAVERQAFGYPLADELSGVPEVASSWLRGHHGLDVEPGGIRLLPELMRGLTAAITHLTQPGSAVAVPTPTYGRFFDAIGVAGRTAVQVPMVAGPDGCRLDLDRLDGALRAGAGSVLLCHPSNPTGRVFDPSHLRELATLADHHGVRVISDEIHAPLRYDTDPDTGSDTGFVPYAAVSQAARDHAITLFSATKAWNFPGLRCGLVALTNEHDRTGWARLPRAEVGGVSPLGMRATTAAFTAGGPWLDRARRHLAANRALLGTLLDEAGLPGVYTPPQATYLAWLDLRRFGLADPARDLLETAGVAVTAGDDHGAGGDGHVRLNFATPPDVLADAVHRIATAVRREGRARPCSYDA